MRWYQMGGRRGGLRVGLPAPVDPDPVDPDPDPGDPLAALKAALTPTGAELVDAMDLQFRAYQVDATFNGSGEGSPYGWLYPWHSQAVSMAAAFADVATAVQSTRGTWTGGVTPADRMVAQLRYWINPTAGAAGGRAPAGRSGYAAQYEAAFVAAAALAVVTPAVWSQLTATERERLDLLMLGCLIGSAFVVSDNSPYAGDWGSRRTIRGYSAGRNNVPNFSSPPRLIVYACRLYLEARGVNVQAALNGFNQAAFAARCAPIGTSTVVGAETIMGIGGLDDLWRTYRRRWTTAVQNEEHLGTGKPVGEGPTTAQILASINGGGSGVYVGLGRGLADLASAYQVEIERVFNATCRPGVVGYAGAETAPGLTGSYGLKGTWTGGVLRGCIADKAAWAGTPYLGQVGAFFELDASDGGEGGGPNVRSSMSYAIHGVIATLALTAVAVAHQAISLNDVGFAEARGRLIRGWAHFLYATQHGYRSYAKGGGNSSNNEDWTAAYATNQNVRLTAASGLVRMLLAA